LVDLSVAASVVRFKIVLGLARDAPRDFLRALELILPDLARIYPEEYVRIVGSGRCVSRPTTAESCDPRVLKPSVVGHPNISPPRMVRGTRPPRIWRPSDE
jgi:hypothetical protein